MAPAAAPLAALRIAGRTCVENQVVSIIQYLVVVFKRRCHSLEYLLEVAVTPTPKL
jgi:hypothetical protein